MRLRFEGGRIVDASATTRRGVPARRPRLGRRRAPARRVRNRLQPRDPAARAEHALRREDGGNGPFAVGTGFPQLGGTNDERESTGTWSRTCAAAGGSSSTARSSRRTASGGCRPARRRSTPSSSSSARLGVQPGWQVLIRTPAGRAPAARGGDPADRAQGRPPAPADELLALAERRRLGGGRAGGARCGDGADRPVRLRPHGRADHDRGSRQHARRSTRAHPGAPRPREEGGRRRSSDGRWPTRSPGSAASSRPTRSPRRRGCRSPSSRTSSTAPACATGTRSRRRCSACSRASTPPTRCGSSARRPTSRVSLRGPQRASSTTGT